MNAMIKGEEECSLNIVEITTFCWGRCTSPSQKFHISIFWIFGQKGKNGKYSSTRSSSNIFRVWVVIWKSSSRVPFRPWSCGGKSWVQSPESESWVAPLKLPLTTSLVRATVHWNICKWSAEKQIGWRHHSMKWRCCFFRDKTAQSSCSCCNLPSDCCNNCNNWKCTFFNRLIGTWTWNQEIKEPQNQTRSNVTKLTNQRQQSRTKLK